MVKATLGGLIDIPTIDGGKLSVSIPEGSQNNKHLRLRGKGMPVIRRSNFGTFTCKLPWKHQLTLQKNKKNYLLNSKKYRMKNKPLSSSFFKKFKDFFRDFLH